MIGVNSIIHDKCLRDSYLVVNSDDVFCHKVIFTNILSLQNEEMLK